MLVLPELMACSMLQSNRGKLEEQEATERTLKKSGLHVRLHNVTVFGQRA